jgi:gas vesicle protein
MATTIVGGGIFIGAIIGTATMLNKLLAPKS